MPAVALERSNLNDLTRSDKYLVQNENMMMLNTSSKINTIMIS